MRHVYDHITKKYELLVWREMISSRDTVMPNSDDPVKFLRSLLALEEG